MGIPCDALPSPAAPESTDSVRLKQSWQVVLEWLRGSNARGQGSHEKRGGRGSGRGSGRGTEEEFNDRKLGGMCSEGLNECDETKRKMCYEGRSKAEARQKAVLMGRQWKRHRGGIE